MGRERAEGFFFEPKMRHFDDVYLKQKDQDKRKDHEPAKKKRLRRHSDICR